MYLRRVVVSVCRSEIKDEQATRVRRSNERVLVVSRHDLPLAAAAAVSKPEIGVNYKQYGMIR